MVSEAGRGVGFGVGEGEGEEEGSMTGREEKKGLAEEDSGGGIVLVSRASQFEQQRKQWKREKSTRKRGGENRVNVPWTLRPLFLALQVPLPLQLLIVDGRAPREEREGLITALRKCDEEKERSVGRRKRAEEGGV